MLGRMNNIGGMENRVRLEKYTSNPTVSPRDDAPWLDGSCTWATPLLEGPDLPTEGES